MQLIPPRDRRDLVSGKSKYMRRGKPRPRSEVESPCISVCEFRKGDEVCKGCERNIDEIREWIIMTDDEKRAVKEAIHARRNP